MAGRNRGVATGMAASERTGANIDDVTMMAHKWRMTTADMCTASYKMELKLIDMVSTCNAVGMTPNDLMEACSKMGVTVRGMIDLSEKEGMSLMDFMVMSNNIAKGPNSSMVMGANNTMMIRPRTGTGLGNGTGTSDKTGSSSYETEKTSSKWNPFKDTKAKNLVTREGKKIGEHGKKKVKSSELLAELRSIILDEATKLRRERPEFCEEIDRLRRNNDEGKELVSLVLKQLEEECSNMRMLQSSQARLQNMAEELDKTKAINWELQKDNLKLLNRIDWSGSEEDRIDYEVKIRNKESTVKDAMEDLREKNQQLLKELIDLKSDKGSIPVGSNGGEIFSNENSTFQTDHRFTEEGVRAKIKEVEEEMRRLHNNEKMKLQSQIRATVQKEHEKEIIDIRSQQKQAVDSIREDLEIVKSRQRENIAKVKQDYSGQIDRLNSQILQLRGQADKADRDHNYQLQTMAQGHDDTVLKLKYEHDTEIERRQNTHKATTDTIEKEFDEALQQANSELKAQQYSWTQKEEDMQQRHKSELRMLEKQHREELSKRGADALAQCTRLTDQMDEMERDQAAKLAERIVALDAEKAQLETLAAEKEASLKKKYQELSATLEEKHAAEKSQLRKDRDAYSAALLERDRARDKVDYLKDVEIKDRFQGLKEEVETLARSEWKTDPGKEKTLKLLTPTPITLMRQVLQHSIWVVLHEHIFCSPFRVFGEEGEKYESDWLNECGGKDPAFDNGAYTWPTPEVDTERWRFMTVKECRAFLRKPASPHDPRAKLKRSFADKRDAIRKTLSETLSEVIDVDKSHVQAIEKLAGKATNVWLEFSMQPYRILIVVQDAKVESIENRIRQARMSSFDLVLVPRLKSFGNSKGQDLKAEATIGNYDGEIVKIETMKPASVMQRGPSRRPSLSR